jgi:hypothetical protein
MTEPWFFKRALLTAKGKLEKTKLKANGSEVKG